MLQTKLSPPNAILFVFDPTNRDVKIPSYVDGELIASTETCISVGTQAEIDGETEVHLRFGGKAPSDLQEVFLGSIEIPGGVVGIVTSQFRRVLEVDVPTGKLKVVIYVDDPRNPSRIMIVLPLLIPPTVP